MKTHKKIMILISAAALAASCYKDLSTEATMEIPDIQLSTDASDTLLCAFGDSLIINPEVSQSGRKADDLDYLWEMDLIAGKSADRVELGTTKDLHYLVRNTPGINPYTLSVTVTDKTTGYAIVKSWQVYVSSSLGEGLVIGHTKDGGKTSELDLIRNKYVTYGYSSDEGHVTRNLYTLGNDGPIEGNVNCISSMVASDGATYNRQYLMVGTDNHLLGLDISTYSVTASDADFITMTSGIPDFRTTMAFNFDGYQFAAVIGGKPFGSNTNMEFQMNPINGDFSEFTAYKPHTTSYGKMRNAQICVWDEDQEAFYYVQGWQHAMAGLSKITNLVYPVPPRDMKCISCGGGKGNILYYVLKFNNGEYHLLGLTLDGMVPGYVFYPMGTCTDMDKAENFCFVDSGDVFFYSVGSTIYYNIINAKDVTCRKSLFEVEDQNEKVTGIYPYYQAWYGAKNYGMATDYEFILSTNRLQLIITTYNGTTGEGKVYIQPFASSTGRLSGNNGIFGGFGKITAVGTSVR